MWLSSIFEVGESFITSLFHNDHYFYRYVAVGAEISAFLYSSVSLTVDVTGMEPPPTAVVIVNHPKGQERDSVDQTHGSVM